MLNSSWILAFRADSLTDIFRLFPFFASEYFFFAIIALGFWLRPSKLLFKSLGFLLPFSAFLNCVLKNIFRIPRPDIFLHLIPMDNSFGFPSGDVQISTVFWATIFFAKKKDNYLAYLYLIPIVMIGVSRVYLGVHSLYDVIGGLIFGILTIWAWKKYLEKSLLITNYQDSYRNFWVLFIITCCLYIAASYGLHQRFPLVLPISIGSLIGFGLSLRWIITLKAQSQERKLTGLTAIISLFILVAVAKFVPTIKINEVILFCTIILKYVLIVFGIFVLIPNIVFKFSRFSGELSIRQKLQ